MARATVASTNARIDAIENKIDALLAMLTESTDKPKTEKPKATRKTASQKPKATRKAKSQKTKGKASTTRKAKEAKADAPVINVKIPGKPSKVYIDREWVWVGWTSKPSDSTIKTLKAEGWKYSKKRNEWHKVNA